MVWFARPQCSRYSNLSYHGNAQKIRSAALFFYVPRKQQFENSRVRSKQGLELPQTTNDWYTLGNSFKTIVISRITLLCEMDPTSCSCYGYLEVRVKPRKVSWKWSLLARERRWIAASLALFLEAMNLAWSLSLKARVSKCPVATRFLPTGSWTTAGTKSAAGGNTKYDVASATVSGRST